MWMVGRMCRHSLSAGLSPCMELLEHVQGLYLYRDVVRALRARWHHVFFAAYVWLAPVHSSFKQVQACISTMMLPCSHRTDPSCLHCCLSLLCTCPSFFLGDKGGNSASSCSFQVCLSPSLVFPPSFIEMSRWGFPPPLH